MWTLLVGEVFPYPMKFIVWSLGFILKSLKLQMGRHLSTQQLLRGELDFQLGKIRFLAMNENRSWVWTLESRISLSFTKCWPVLSGYSRQTIPAFLEISTSVKTFLKQKHLLFVKSFICKCDAHFPPRILIFSSLISVSGDANESAEDAFVRRAKEGMGNDEAQFSVEFPVTGKMYLWADKYRPRKPRFFNRVHTGFEWNKYNQTHYDFDNPPPKIVQGYKFNIFYPDLIDKRSTPQYFLEPSPENKDFGILRFHAGPPYEDIAFKIVNREWEYSHRHGFRCQFANGIFQLWFHFKRYRYRR